MAGVSLNHRTGVINRESDLIDLNNKHALSDALYHRLLKASALSQIALHMDYKQHTQATLFEYFNALNDYVDEAVLIAEYLEVG